MAGKMSLSRTSVSSDTPLSAGQVILGVGSVAFAARASRVRPSRAFAHHFITDACRRDAPARFWSVVTATDIRCTRTAAVSCSRIRRRGDSRRRGDRPNCLFFQQVTLGANAVGFPKVGGHVDIGAGAKIIGPITIGDHAQIGANAVVLCDVPAWATAVGVPAKILRRPPTE